ncbi:MULTISPECIES: NAD-dependent epimerase/dehydratase family protein [unclassified Bradyrhizobium]|uniref:NAD-dependent epimerase/dehydratase family protein n=1 Tax=unclassified Bradyrhizobium TaxID=2631580 RepID=UPI001FF7C3B0|nr:MULTISPECIES: NAD-dependent epimerase/dehydratase family protein [unclassified Bradyrhizobium]MCK1709103.1 NAD(P)-dependent oxidoreductase [Bradyrhizobium sp. 143]MCK1726397.1 NAD(P)-dependent oxidoreductase [Bradyrhizobium sp. 142]
MAQHKDVVIVTGSTGFIGSALINRFAGQFRLIGLDRAATHQPPPAAECVCIDLTSEEAIAAGLRRVRLRISSAAGGRVSQEARRPPKPPRRSDLWKS